MDPPSLSAREGLPTCSPAHTAAHPTLPFSEPTAEIEPEPITDPELDMDPMP